MDLTKDQKLLLMSAHPDTLEAMSPAPEWLVQECADLGLVERIGRTGAWKLTEAGIEARRELLGE